jgi:hypothetical protein
MGLRRPAWNGTMKADLGRRRAKTWCNLLRQRGDYRNSGSGWLGSKGADPVGEGVFPGDVAQILRN